MDLLSSYENSITQSINILGWDKGKKSNALDSILNNASSDFRKISLPTTEISDLSNWCKSENLTDPRKAMSLIAESQNIYNKRVVIIESLPAPITDDLILKFHHGYIGNSYSEYKAILKNTPFLYKHWNYGHDLEPSELNYDAAIQKCDLPSPFESKNIVQVLIYTFLQQFDLIVDLSNTTIYKRLADIQTETLLETNTQLTSPISFDSQMVLEAICEYTSSKDIFTPHDRTTLKLEVLGKTTNRFKKLDKTVVTTSDNHKYYPYLAEHALIIFQVKHNKYAHLYILDMQKLKDRQNNSSIDIESIVLVRAGSFLAEKLRFKYKNSAKTRVYGTEHSTIAPKRIKNS